MARIVVPHEQPAVAQMLQHVPLAGRLVTVPTQRDGSQVFEEGGATGVAPVTGNQPPEGQAACAVWPHQGGSPTP